MADGVVARFALDTYDREVERYGGLSGVALAEAVFAIDSHAVAELLRLELSGDTALDRLALAMVSADALLADLGMDEQARLSFYQLLAGRLRAEGTTYRQRKTEFCALLGHQQLEKAEDADAIRQVLVRRRSQLARPVALLSDLDHRGELSRTITELCQSYVHLHCNRLLGRGRSHERNLFELLLRTRRALDAGA